MALNLNFGNPDQAMVDNATSALARQNGNLMGKRSKSPVAKPSNNGRADAIARRLNARRSQ
jgi:hypothetical protein